MTTQQSRSHVWQPDLVFLDCRLHKSISNESVKVHAMRQWHDKRRHSQASRLFPRGGTLQPWTQPLTQSRSTVKKPVARQDIPSLPLVAEHRANQSPSKLTEPCHREFADRKLPASIIGPCDALGAGRGDPFAQYPYRQSRSVDMLLDHCTWRECLLAFLELTVHLVISSKVGILCPELISLYRADPVSFSSFLAVIATHFSTETSHQTGISVDEAEGRALRLLNDRLGNCTPVLHRGTILGIALIANLEECRGNRAIADLHWNGLNQAIEAKGGLKDVVKCKELHATLFWLEVITSNSKDCCLGQLSSRFHLDQAPFNREDMNPASFNDNASNNITIPTKGGLKREYDQFFKTIVHHVSEDHLAATEFNISDCIINSIQKKREEEPQRLRRSQMASLLYLAAVKIDNIYNPEVFSNFTLQIHRETYSRAENYTLCGEELLHMLFNGVGLSGSQSCRYSCLTSRLMCVARFLPPDAWNTVFGTLLYFLGIP